MSLFYRFAEPRYWIGEPQMVGLAPAEVVQQFFGEEALKKAFGGWVVYSDRKGARYLGVWGEARVRALTAALEKMGLKLEITEHCPAGLELRQRST